jgi:hypothetical protein
MCAASVVLLMLMKEEGLVVDRRRTRIEAEGAQKNNNGYRINRD